MKSEQFAYKGGSMRFWSVLAGLLLVIGVGCGNLGQGCAGLGSALDTDGDGVADVEDNCPMTANAEQVDADGDGVGDACDTDETDPDGDGIEADDNCPNDANPDQEDADEDGVGDACDNCVNTANENQADADADGVGDACEGDRDDDGVADDVDNCLTIANPDQTDTDDDGFGDACDNAPGRPNPGQEDTDGDGIADVEDNCPDDANPNQEDADEDGFGDECDNCKNDSNEDQADADGDGTGDACEGDKDGDDVDDNEDNCPDDANPDQEDADDDGVGDECDNCEDNANPNQEDADDDGVGDECDNCDNVANLGQDDCDGDGIGDACDDSNDDPSCDTGGGGGPDPVDVDVGGNQPVSPCQSVTLDATTTPSSATVTWTQTNGPTLGIDNAADPLTFFAPAEPTGLPAIYTFEATGTADGFTTGSDSVSVTVLPFGALVEFAFDATTSSGAAIPGDEVELTLSNELKDGAVAGETQTFGEWRATWRQAVGVCLAGDTETTGCSSDAQCDSAPGEGDGLCAPARVVLGAGDDPQSATFTAPEVSETTNLNFVVGICRLVMTEGEPDTSEGTIELTESVSVQTATVTFDLPASIAAGEVVALADFVTLSGEPVEAELFFFASIDGDAPVTIDNETGTMTVGNDVGAVVQVSVTVLATAGPLATTSDTFTISGPG